MVVKILALLVAISLPAQADDSLSRSHECEDHPEVFAQKVDTLTLDLFCQHASREKCQRLRSRTPGGVGVAIAIGKAVALNRSFVPIVPQLKCQTTNPVTNPAEVVLTPFVNLIEMWLANTSAIDNGECVINPEAKSMVARSVHEAVAKLKNKRRGERDPFQRREIDERVRQLQMALKDTPESEKGLDRQLIGRVERVASQLGDRDLAQGAFRWAADGMGIVNSAAGLRFSARHGLQMLARAHLISASAEASFRSDPAKCRHSLYGTVDERCRYQFVRDLKFHTLLTAPLETQLYEMKRYPQMCGAVIRAFEELPVPLPASSAAL